MEQSKLKIIFESLSDDQIRRFSKYLDSPIHNKNVQVSELFAVLKRQQKRVKRDYSNEYLFEKVFSKEKYEVSKIHYVKSYLNKCLEEFLAWEEYQEREQLTEFHLLRAYAHLGLEKPFRQTINRAKKQIEKDPLANDQRLRELYQLKYEEHHFDIRTQGRTQDFKLQSLNDSLEQAFFAEKLKIACGMLSHQSVAKKKYEAGFIEPIISYLKDHPYLEIPGIGCYYYGWKSLTNPQDDVAPVKLKALVKKSAAAFPLDELRDIYVLAINTCIRQINLGKKDFVSESFDLYKSGLELGLFLRSGKLSPWTYINIAASGLLLKEFEWVFDFIYKYKSFLPEVQQEGFFNFNLARYYFSKKDYPSAMPLLALQDYQDVLTHLSAKTMLAKMYFELDEFDALDTLLSSLKTYIYRKKVLGYHKENYLAVINFMNKLTSVGSVSRVDQNKLKDEISSSSVSEKEWLLEQLA